ncbi:MAG: hypothetical protein P8R54_29985 [Myxococcota bacterium]|nr:hypothetical protein [Myxococcota bacterium]
MNNAIPFDPSTSSRQLLRLLRLQPDRAPGAAEVLPESVLWRIYCELRKRGEDGADKHFLRSLTQLYRRRTMSGIHLSTTDPNPNEHRLVDDPMLAEIWKAYKRCICSSRPGQAGRLLKDIEAQLKC